MKACRQVPSFALLDEQAAARSTSDGLVVKVCTLDDLLAMKRADDRPRDRDDVEALEAAREGAGAAPANLVGWTRNV